MDDRSIALARRNALSKAEIEIKSKQIVTRLMPYLHGRVAMYMAMDHEVVLQDLQTIPQLTLCIPVAYKDHTMKFFAYDETTRLVKSQYGIWEPQGSKEISKQDIQVMIVPMVAYDESLHRLGHGAGYYDRYLADFVGVKIGVAFACQKVAHIEAKPHDIRMDMIVTEDAIL